jgi:GNAT superfamily N-acetyltransferase
MVLSKGQFPNADISYRYADVSADKKVVMASHPEQGLVGMINFDRLNPGARASGLTSALAYVHPDFRRRGIASAMYNIGAHEVGYSPMHDTARTPLGDKLARSVGGAIPAGYEKPLMKQWDITGDDIHINEKQGGTWDRGTDIDPTVAKALTPVKPKRSRGKKPEQLGFEGMEGK